MSVTARLHGHYVHRRRVRVLCDYLAPLIPSNGRVLDVGCGDGLLASLILERRRDAEICGLDVLVREHPQIPVTGFNGSTIPFPDSSFDVVMLVDVLHHTVDPRLLLSEAKRVAATAILIKDHRLNGFLAGPTLRIMDWVSNAPHGVVLQYNYWSDQTWQDAFASLHLSVGVWQQDLQLYPNPANLVFGRSLHFISRLDL